MPLKHGSSRKVISGNIREMLGHPGKHFKGIIRKYGKAKAAKMAAAAAYRSAGKSKRNVE